jgi:hypothetical protein
MIYHHGRVVFYNGDAYEGMFENETYQGKGRYYFGEHLPFDGWVQGVFEDNRIKEI